MLEDSTRADEGGSKMTSHGITNSGGLDLAEMTFAEIVKKLNQLLGSGQNGMLIEQQLNQRSIQHLVDLAFRITEGFEGHVKAELLEKCNLLVWPYMIYFTQFYQRPFLLLPKCLEVGPKWFFQYSHNRHSHFWLL